MNANELAKLLEVDSWYKLVTREKIATMLRAQQAEIEALKKQLAFMEGEYPEPTIMAKMIEVDLVRQQQAEIEALKKNNDTISYWRYKQLAKENMWLLDQLNKLKDPQMDFSKHNRIMDKLYPNSHWEHLPKDTDK